MEVYGLSRLKHSDALSGKGAALNGARWNSKGVELIYAAANRSLAMAEIAVHFTVSTLPSDFFMMTVLIPDDIGYKEIFAESLPCTWNEFPHNNSTKKIGDHFIFENKFCFLKVPSAVVKGEYNILINPYHDDFSRIQIVQKERFPFDKRIFK